MIYFATALGGLFCLFWIAQLVFVLLHRGWTNKILQSDDRDKDVHVTFIHPIKDLDFEFDKNLESWFNQDYRGKIQHIFSFQDPDDPAIPVVEAFKQKNQDRDIQIIVNPVMAGLNGKSSNMVNGIRKSKYDIVLFADSDIRVNPDFVLKMVRPLSDEKNGITTCGQINMGGRDFWTRFFTFCQNSETDFMWALFTKMKIDVGATGAAFAMRKKLLQDIGGLEAFGGSLLEDLHLGNTLYKLGYRLVLGPFLECHVDELAKEKSFNYARRIATGIKAHIAVELPAFILMLFWYWLLFVFAVITWNTDVLVLTLVFMGIRVVHGLMMRVVSNNRVLPADIIMPLFFDVFATFFLLFSLRNSSVSWRGIKYEVKKGGFIEEKSPEGEISEEPAVDEQK